MITAVLCAAGKGERAGFSENKVLRERNGLPLLCYSLSAFAQCAEITEILVVCRKEDEVKIRPLLSPYPRARTVIGGELRTHSVYAALKEAAGDIVLVHDAARPFLTQKIISACIESVKNFGSGVCAVPSVDTVALAKNGCILKTPPRSTVYAAQTPQGFSTGELLGAYREMFEEHREAEFTDESGIYAYYCKPPRICEGDRNNKKLTYAEDFLPAERVGFGVDTHAFMPQKNASPFFGDPDSLDFPSFITLGGVRIPSEHTLIAHSDGDVLLHALMDALLSAAGLRDIGYYFPDTDEKYAGADSLKLLKEVLCQIEYCGFAPKNVSIAVLAEKPRLSPHIEDMKENLSKALNLPLSAIGIAAGTNEKLGYVGEGKGVTVYATVMLKQTKEAI